jgi:hypothetical protein
MVQPLGSLHHALHGLDRAAVLTYLREALEETRMTHPANVAGVTGLVLSLIPWTIMFVMGWLQPS